MSCFEGSQSCKSYRASFFPPLTPGKMFDISSLLSLFFLICGVSSQKHSENPREDISCIGNALQEGLIYLRNHNDAKTLDVAVGVLLVKGNLRWIGNRWKHNSRKISQLSHLCDVIFLEIHTVHQCSNDPKDRKFSALLRHIFDDIVAEDLKFGRLNRKSSIGLPDFKNCSFFTNYVLRGTPKDSDSCIIELFDKSCDISSACWFEETNQMAISGYKISHRLLYMQLALMLKCGKDERRMKRMKASMCQSMLEEAIALYGNNVFFARDLFLEHIALCGFEGYIEFSDKSWTISIPQWQSSEGCFGRLPGEQLPQESCGWRSDINGTVCSVHLTAVAVSAMAFHLRVAFDRL